MKPPLVSFVIAAYNEEEYIGECLESCLSQSYPNIEVIITDDGSTDRTYDLVSSCYAHDRQVSLLRHPENRGKVAAFNTSYAHAQGEYVAIIGADDINYPERVQLQVETAEEASVGLLASDLDMVSAEGSLIQAGLVSSYFGLTEDCSLSFDDLLRNPKVYGSTILCRRSCSDQLFPLDTALTHEDWWLPAMATYYSGGRHIAKSLVAYRRHATNDTGDRPGIAHFYQTLTRDEPYYRKMLEFILQQNLLDSGEVTLETLYHIKAEIAKSSLAKAHSLGERGSILSQLVGQLPLRSVLKQVPRLAPLPVVHFITRLSLPRLRRSMHMHRTKGSTGHR